MGHRKCLEVCAVLDISKAFDKVWHDGLLFKLKQNGVAGSVLALLRSYLSNRKQWVVLNRSLSEHYPIESGDPQGSVLGPLLFLVYINPISHGVFLSVLAMGGGFPTPPAKTYLKIW